MFQTAALIFVQRHKRLPCGATVTLTCVQWYVDTRPASRGCCRTDEFGLTVGRESDVLLDYQIVEPARMG